MCELPEHLFQQQKIKDFLFPLPEGGLSLENGIRNQDPGAKILIVIRVSLLLGPLRL